MMRPMDVFYETFRCVWIIEVPVCAYDYDLKKKKVTGVSPTKPTKRQLRQFYKKSKEYWA